MIRIHHNHKLQTNPWHREEEPLTNYEEDKLSKATSSLSHQAGCKTRMDIKPRTTKHRKITDSHNGSNKKQQINNNRTTALERTPA